MMRIGMMTKRLKQGVVTFNPYNPTGKPVTIVCSRILCWHPIDFNANPGTEIYLDGGSTIRVKAYASDVEKQVLEEVQDD